MYGLHSETMALLRSLLPDRPRRFLILTLFWFLVGTLSALHWQLFFAGKNPYTWWELYRVKLALWYLWGILTPVILWLAWRFPLAGRRLWVNLPLLVMGSLVYVLAYLILYTGLLILNRVGEPPLSNTPEALFRWVIGVHSTWYFLAFWATVGVEHSVAHYRRFREREQLTNQLEAQLVEAQLAALREQLHPHFLFNTLHSILILVRQARNEDAIKMLTGLSGLLRRSLEHARRHEVPLEEEVAFLRQYIEIERIRFSDRLEVDWLIDPTVLDAQVPAFILQPLAENAIKHGLEQLTGSGRIEVACHQENGRLCLRMTDNGVGPPVDLDVATGAGHGLGDMRARLEVLYQSSYSLTIGYQTGKGTIVELKIPLYRDVK